MAASSFSGITIPPELQAFFKRHLNFHRVLWALTLVTFFIAWNRGLALLYGLFSLLAALLVISYLSPKWQLRNIHVKRNINAEYTAGRPGSITYELEVKGTRYHVELIDSLEFVENRELRFFFGQISRRASCQIRFNCLQRGCYRIESIQLASAYPFGIVRFTTPIQTESLEILVFPKVFALSRIPMPLTADATTWGEVCIPQKGGRDEFTAVREYVHGDELSRIHWPVSARHQNLTVKEYEKTDRPSLLIVLNCSRKFHIGRGHQTTFEWAVSIAASMIRFACREGMPCFLVARSDRLRELTIQAYSAELYTLYEFLARLNCDSALAYHPVVEQAHRQFPQANLITTFRLDSDTIHPRLSPHVTQIDLEMDANSFRSNTWTGAPNGLHRVGKRLIYRIFANQDPESLFQ